MAQTQITLGAFNYFIVTKQPKFGPASCKPPPVNVQNFTSTPPTVTATTTHPLPKQ